MQLFKRLFFPLLFALVFAGTHFGVWSLANRALPLINVKPAVHGFAYSAFRTDQSPFQGEYPSTAELVQDLDLLKKHSNRIRVYSSIDNAEVTALAAKRNMTVIAGAWINKDSKANAREIAALQEKLKNYSNIERATVGNEAILRGDISPEDLIVYLDAVRASTDVPISTAEPWHIWIKYPELVKHVDYIAIHLLPYHEGVPIENAVQYSIDRYHELMDAFPRKKIVITEIGWPSRGPTIGASVASEVNQARFVREFLARNATEELDFYLMEPFDQP